MRRASHPHSTGSTEPRAAVPDPSLFGVVGRSSGDRGQRVECAGFGVIRGAGFVGGSLIDTLGVREERGLCRSDGR